MDTFKISDDGQTVIVSADGVNNTFSLVQVEAMIDFFGVIRGQMNPPVPHDQSPSEKFRPLDNLFVRHTRAGQVPTLHGAVLVAGSSQFGWFEYPMTGDYCAGLIEWLRGNSQALAAPPGLTLN
jgi:hypothetical protein